MSAESATTLKKSLWGKSAGRLVSTLLRHDELAAVVIIAIHLYVDWYLGLAFLAQILTLGLLFVIYRHRSAQHPWVFPRALWLWTLFLVLAILPALRAISLKDGAYYYFNVIFYTLPMFWLGLVIAQDVGSLRRLFKMLSIFAALLAIVTIIQARTGVLLFKSTRYDASIASLAHFELGNTGIYRAESFLLNPDSNGAWFALMLLLPLGLYVESISFRAKVLYLVEMFLMLLALLFTYSTGASIAAAVGVVSFIVFAGRMRYRIQISLFVPVAAVGLIIVFPSQVHSLLQHASTSAEWSLRLGVWQTGIHVILAFPLTGIGLGRYIYILRAEPYRVPAQFIPVYHPHNSFLELAALGGIPLALLFIALLSLALWLAVQNWIHADVAARTLLAGGLAAIIALSFYSLTNAGWTLTPLTALGWLVLGAISSPLLTRSQKSELADEEKEGNLRIHANQHGG